MKHNFFTFLFCLGYSIMASAQEKPCAPGRYTPAFFNPTLILAGNEPPHHAFLRLGAGGQQGRPRIRWSGAGRICQKFPRREWR